MCAVTSTPGSTVGTRAHERALVTVLHQRAVTHTQAFCGNVAAALAIWAEITSDDGLARALSGLPALVGESIAATLPWLETVPEVDPTVAIAFGSGPGWAAALETALLLKEISGVPAEGVETREGATSAMMALRPGHLVVGLPVGVDPLLDEAETICAGRGATVVAHASAGRRPPPGSGHDLRPCRRAVLSDRSPSRARRRQAGVDGRLLQGREATDVMARRWAWWRGGRRDLRGGRRD